MQHLNTETYNNEQVSKVFIQNFAEACVKMDYFASKSLNRQPLGDPPQKTPVYSASARAFEGEGPNLKSSGGQSFFIDFSPGKACCV